MAICELRNASRHYGQGPTLVKAADALNLVIEAGEFTVLSGPSGSGKTTALNMIGLLDHPTSGSVFIQDQQTETLGDHALTVLRAHAIGFIFQSFNLVPVLSALENVELALTLAGITPAGGVRDAASEALASVGLGDLLHRRPTQLSGGQQQRVAVARALVKKPALVIADEPTANLDSVSGTNVLELMRELNENLGVTFLFSTHDPMVIERARRVIHMKDGRIDRDESITKGEVL
ncbi:MAG: putative ABC transport system ATP-binding protein [Myxococcota bacterium]|jgi:putative ABC transport system ATP-binding protein